MSLCRDGVIGVVLPTMSNAVRLSRCDEMGYEVVIYGVSVGSSYRTGAYTELQIRNEHVIRSLQRDEDWPWVDLSIFALPGPYPLGSYRRQIIHFGLSIKDDPPEYPKWWNTWLIKFEAVLRRLYWLSARLHIERDCDPQKEEYTWVPTNLAIAAQMEDLPQPVASWERTVRTVSGTKMQGT